MGKKKRFVFVYSIIKTDKLGGKRFVLMVFLMNPNYEAWIMKLTLFGRRVIDALGLIITRLLTVPSAKVRRHDLTLSETLKLFQK